MKNTEPEENIASNSYKFYILEKHKQDHRIDATECSARIRKAKNNLPTEYVMSISVEFLGVLSGLKVSSSREIIDWEQDAEHITVYVSFFYRDNEVPHKTPPIRVTLDWDTGRKFIDISPMTLPKLTDSGFLSLPK